MELDTSHYDFENFIELVGGEVFDVIGAGFKVATNVGENSEVSMDRGSIALEDFKIGLADRHAEPNTLIISDGVVENGLNSRLGVLVEDAHFCNTMMKNQQNMPRIRCLIDYLRPVSDALSYEQYDHPERIVSLLWAKEKIDILADKESLEKELSESVTMPDMGDNLQSLYSCLAFIAQEPKEFLFGFNNVTYFYNEFSLHKGY